ncbi:MAG: glycine cleavage system protein [Geminicoccaceae bacterium]|nr:glycine cleavage system protein [Solirubrobacterales bacterium]MCE3246418.1 glycine cleavage system protein [Geminicoccaceae bacterium]
MEASAALRHTPLYDAHVAAGARLVAFAGWEMPVQYAGVGAEHRAVRDGCGVFDVSHMGEIETEGPGALGLLQRLLSNDVSRIEVGGAQYSVLCKDDGGVLDDLFTYRLADDRYLTVTNAANHGRDLGWFRDHAHGFDAEVRDRLDDYAMLAVQGPEARGIVARLVDAELPLRMRTATLPLVAGIGGAEALVCGTGYTGEDGVEILVAPQSAAGLWDALLESGATPAGLGARDTLRLEVCFHLYGNDLSEGRNPIEAGLGWCCKEETGFIGADAVATARLEGTAERLAPFALTERGIPRQGNPVLFDGDRAGEVTSGTFSPSLERGIGMAYVRSELAEPGTEVELDVRGRRRAARVEKRPLLALAGERA